ncbi:hypothetical protein Nepgr_004944 [Nepenthes gracilis]|uniref:QWRF motif-containing protein 2 n=1 Tax=Nepenthes gracilis TaxID=150966 RepID=A0AAD3XFU3_NEPGR|nr:hypothetical protein Nepgr_004944 [Nepenthes gracilis]
MVVAISRQEIHENGATSRPAFLPSERENGFPGRRPRAREVPSRYMSPSSSTTTTTTSSTSSSSSAISRRFPSPLVSRTSSNSIPRRSQSVDRRRPATPKPANASEVSAATKLLVTSTRSLSVSFQGETFSLPISKTKPVNLSNNGRKSTPERRRVTPSRGKVDGDQAENPKSVDQQRWPGRTQPSNPLSRSLDCYYMEKKVIESAVLARALQESLTDESRRASIDGISNFNSGNGDVLSGIGDALDASSMNESSIPSDLTASDTESVSSGSTSGAHESNGVARGRSGPGGIMVSARFWQETQMRLRRLQDSGSMLSTSPSSKMAAPSKFNQSRKFRDEPLMCPRTISSPIRGITRPASPAKLITSSTSSPLRGISPSRLRSPVAGSLNGYFCDTPSVFSFYVDVRRGRVGENRIVDAHQLRLLYNRHLQWRFMNASADTALLLQRQIAEKSLWNAWRAIACICDSVRHKRTQLQLLKQKLKLTFVLRGQITYLEEWSHLDKEHLSSLQGAIEALKASTLRLPVVGGAIVDIQSVKEAVCSTVEVMQAMSSSMCLLFTRVEEVKSLLAELENTAAKERALLEQCKHILSTLVSMQVKDCSLRTHVLQLNRLPIA